MGETEALVRIHICLTLLDKLSKCLLPIASIASTDEKINHICDAITVKLDSGATRHFFKDDHKHILSDLKKIAKWPSCTVTQ